MEKMLKIHSNEFLNEKRVEEFVFLGENRKTIFHGNFRTRWKQSEDFCSDPEKTNQKPNGWKNYPPNCFLIKSSIFYK